MSEPERHPALDALAQAEVPGAVQARIVAGAQARVARHRPLAPWIAAAIASGAVAASALALWVARPAPAGDPAPQPSVQAVPGHRVLAEPGARWQVVEALGDGQRVALSAGAAEFAVQPLRGDDAYVVETPQARVRVVGTRFRVAVEGDCTAVAVSEGVVQVSRLDGTEPASLTAGQQRRICPSPAAQPPRAGVLGPPPGQAWVQQALELIGRGEQPAQARTLMERYLAAYPDGPLAQEALYYAARLALEAGDRPAALARARAFVQRFPDSHRTAWLEGRLPELGAE